MKRFLKTLFVFSMAGMLVTFVLASTYFYFDPFKVLRSYNDYSYPHVIANRDFISTEMFLKNDQKYHYNSFVFGSSRTMAFIPESWKKHLSSDAVPFMFDASAESIYGIDKKIRFLTLLHIPMNHVLLVFDRDVTFKTTENNSEHLYIKHPLLTGQNRLTFQFVFFKAYLDFKFLRHFYDYAVTGLYKPDMNGFLENRKIKYDTVTNQMKILDQEKEITEEPEHYYETRKKIFYNRNGERTDSVQRIQNAHLEILRDIHRILEKNHSEYKIILSPLYEQVKFSPTDQAKMLELFRGHLYDFTGSNVFTNKMTNYYETAHFRPVVGDSILTVVYGSGH